MGTDTLGSQSKPDKEKDRSKGETRNSALVRDHGSSPPATDTATAFQSDQQYPATATEPVIRNQTTQTPAEEVEEKRARARKSGKK
ncbi:MAG: hypothetical protein ABI347_06910 [Nitrososphaera sp.]|jgi:hypothetical protein